MEIKAKAKARKTLRQEKRESGCDANLRSRKGRVRGLLPC
jgi:hypothetical protein